jgi:hypothetical protein
MWCSGKTGALENVNEISGACYKRFKTEAQAKAFIDDWKQSYTEVWCRELRQALDMGLRPRDMKMSIQGVLYERSEDIGTRSLEQEFEAKLSIDDDKGESKRLPPQF